MPELEPITREEKFLNGEVGMTPITREEKILAGEDIETVTRREYFLKKYRGGGGGDVTVVPLSVTDNGTYSEEGKAYSPVSVNVPLPTNAYLLKSVTTPTPIASFTDGEEMVMPSLKVAIEPQQDLHGYDSPWVGGAGKNKLNLDFTNDTDSFSGLTFTHTDSTIKLKGTVSESSYYIFNLTLPPNLDLNTDYTLSAIVTGTVERCLAGVYLKNGNTDVDIIRIDISNTTPKETKQISAQFDNALFVFEGLQSGSYFDCEVKIQLEKGSSATTFAPYSNICPISGWDEVNANVSPLNIAPLYNGQIYADGTWVSSDKRLTNTSSAQDNSYFLKAGTYTLDYDKLNSNAPSLLQCSALTKDDNYTIIDDFASAWNSLPFTFTLTQDGYLYFTIRKDADTNLNPSDYRAKILGHTYTIDLDGTRYGGILDVVNGIVTPAPYYASYNGETLTGEWISDRDKYEVGATPTIGAQVVNIGASGTPVSILPTAVKSLRGVNNVWADTGDITDAEYFSKEV